MEFASIARADNCLRADDFLQKMTFWKEASIFMPLEIILELMAPCAVKNRIFTDNRVGLWTT